MQTTIHTKPSSQKRQFSDLTHEILEAAETLVRIPSITVGAIERLDEVHRAKRWILQYVQNAGLQVRAFDDHKYPALLITFPSQPQPEVMLSGHFDVVAPEPDDSQFEPYIEGNYFWGRGTGDMKVVVATYLVWMKNWVASGNPAPSIGMLLVGNEENGEGEPMGTGFVLDQLKQEGYQPDVIIAGERTEETGTSIFGDICAENRGVARFTVNAHGVRAHSGMSQGQDLTERLIDARRYLSRLADEMLTLTSDDNWTSQIRFPFVQIGIPGVYNITPDFGTLGVEIRVIPQDNATALFQKFVAYAEKHDLEIVDLALEEGVACDVENPNLQHLIASVREVSGQEPVMGRKLAGTSARFAPNGNGIVWGQSGIGPHSRNERHHIPSIEPYYRVLNTFGEKLADPAR